MASVLAVYRAKALDSTVDELSNAYPETRILRANSTTKARQHIFNHKPSAILVHENIRDSLEFCREVKGNSELSQIAICYFVGRRSSVTFDKYLFDVLYKQDSYTPAEVIARIGQSF